MYYNRRRQEPPPLEEGDKVWLLTRNLKTNQLSPKLDYKKISPFEIKQKLSSITFKLKLLKNIRRSPVFHVALLELAPQNAQTPEYLEGEI